MPTLSEYKAMMEGAIDAPIGYADISSVKRWDILRGTKYACNEKCYLPFSRVPCETEDFIFGTPLYLHADNLTPELIRIIELAESALEDAVSLLQEHGYSLNEHKQALSEIRKLRGE
jgi:hypothetical protein